jgi:hypothetical protein
MRPIIEALDALDRYQSEIITIGSNANFAWLYRYQGDMTDLQANGITVSSFNGNQLVLSNLPSVTSSTVLFASGDLIQIQNSPHPFTVVNTVVRGSGSTVTLTTHRPNIISSSVVGRNIQIGQYCQIRVFSPNMPTYRLTPGAFQRNISGVVTNNAIVEWDDSFQLYEDLSTV